MPGQNVGAKNQTECTHSLLPLQEQVHVCIALRVIIPFMASYAINKDVNR